MARNIDKDKKEEMGRRRQLLDAGLRLFSQKGIETVSLQAVVSETDVGIATMYNYYQNKVNFVVSISADMWSSVWDLTLKKIDFQELAAFSLYSLTEFYCDMIIELYRNKPHILRFSGNYKTYLCRENVPIEATYSHLNVLKPIDNLYHSAFTREKEAGNICTDISEEEMFRNSAMTMLAMAERYAEGIVWISGENTEHVDDLRYVKEMILLWCRSQMKKA